MRLLLLMILLFSMNSCGLVDLVLVEKLGDESVIHLKLDYHQEPALFTCATKVEGMVINTSNDTICNVKLKITITKNKEFVRHDIFFMKQINPHDTCRFKDKIETSMEEDLIVELISSRYRTFYD